RAPVGAVGMNAPDAPAARVAQALRFEGAEEDTSVLEDDRVQGTADVEVADLLDVAAVIVHDEELHGRAIAPAWPQKAIAVADKGDAPPRQRAGVHVVNALPGRRLALLPNPGVACPLLPCQAHRLACLRVDLVHVGAAASGQVVEVSVIDPLRVEGD